MLHINFQYNYSILNLLKTSEPVLLLIKDTMFLERLSDDSEVKSLLVECHLQELGSTQTAEADSTKKHLEQLGHMLYIPILSRHTVSE